MDSYLIFPCIVYQDTHLSLMDGIKLARLIKLYDSDIIVIVITANALEEDIQAIRKEGLMIFS